MSTDVLTPTTSRRPGADLVRVEPAANPSGAEQGRERSPAASGSAAIPSVWRDYVQLTKPRIVVMILVATLATAWIGAAAPISFGDLFWLLIGTAAIAGSAGAANQIWEQSIDRRMTRTANRPLASGRQQTVPAMLYALLLGVAGTTMLAVAFGLTPAMAGVATWLLYVLVYTPMKTRTAWNTTVGAVAGALPMLIGYTATGGRISDWTPWLLVGVMVAWQYPHFMAIAWMYRRQYAAAGFCMTTTVEPTGRSAGWQSVLGSLALIGCAVALCWIPGGVWGAIVGTIAVIIASGPMLLASVRFLVEPSDPLARRLLRSSLLVLPAVLAVVTIRVFW